MENHRKFLSRIFCGIHNIIFVVIIIQLYILSVVAEAAVLLARGDLAVPRPRLHLLFLLLPLLPLLAADGGDEQPILVPARLALLSLSCSHVSRNCIGDKTKPLAPLKLK